MKKKLSLAGVINNPNKNNAEWFYAVTIISKYQVWDKHHRIPSAPVPT